MRTEAEKLRLINKLKEAAANVPFSAAARQLVYEGTVLQRCAIKHGWGEESVEGLMATAKEEQKRIYLREKLLLAIAWVNGKAEEKELLEALQLDVWKGDMALAEN